MDNQKSTNQKVKNSAYMGVAPARSGFQNPTKSRFNPAYLLNSLLHAVGLGTFHFEYKPGGIVLFLKKHWFVVSVAVLVVLIVLKKQVSFSYGSSASNVEQTKDKKKDKKSASNATATASILPTELFTAPGLSDAQTAALSDELTEADVRDYVIRFTDVARREERKFGIPAGVTLGLAIMNSRAGHLGLALTGNNHFQIRCKDNLMAEGAVGSQELNGVCFQTYQNAWTSFRANSLLLTKGKFAGVKAMAKKDYKRWARGLSEAGYSSSSTFSQVLCATIEHYGLNKI